MNSMQASSFEVIARVTYPAPWRYEVRTGTNRAAIVDAGGEPVICGMNIFKAKIITAAINDKATMLAALRGILKAEFSRATPTLLPEYRRAIEEAIAKSEGRTEVNIAAAFRIEEQVDRARNHP